MTIYTREAKTEDDIASLSQKRAMAVLTSKKLGDIMLSGIPWKKQNEEGPVVLLKDASVLGKWRKL